MLPPVRLRKLTPFALLFLIASPRLSAQTVGGSTVYNFLNLPATPALSAAGGVNVSYNGGDVGLALNNPALLDPSLHSQVSANFNAFFAATKAYQLGGVYYAKKWNTTFGGGLFFVDYGSLPQGDIYGNELGNFHPTDFSFQVSAARSYGERWRYGLTAKVIRSSFGSYRSTGLAFDLGLHYADTARRFSAGLTARNMGGQLSGYGGSREDLPFDLQAGVTKRLARAPFGFSLTAQHINGFNTTYNDGNFNAENGFTGKDGFAAKLFNHFVLASHLYLGRNFEVTFGYNFLRRYELNVGSSGNGLNGFSTGFRARFNRLQVQYARAYFQRGNAYNQLGLQLPLQRRV
ncbi:type IX secretion system protein PorQ [Flaviaesturariibacter flavus]|uniref:Type IX secretion system protein PorQ n=1 Tax=Flaviaesturariibacter flavus TaxID=2502780 RepID=A0A4R1B7V7_9BACT|nr:type IX secretion system protein PorQ [Flaviaesturariibacter flavus]TCJ12013.1 type IX secretion system protein PorQ [Flaviaesturariibacter flavus]